MVERFLIEWHTNPVMIPKIRPYIVGMNPFPIEKCNIFREYGETKVRHKCSQHNIIIEWYKEN